MINPPMSCPLSRFFKAGFFKKKEEAGKIEAGADDSKAASAMAMLSMRKVSEIMTRHNT